MPTNGSNKAIEQMKLPVNRMWSAKIRVDVGMTSRTPQERFQQHRTGYRNAKGLKLSSEIVRKYGRYHRPSLYRDIGPFSRAEALEEEKGLTLELRRKGYAVWSN